MNKVNKLNQNRLKDILSKLESNFNLLNESKRINRMELTFHAISETNDSNDMHLKTSNSCTITISIFPTWIIQGLCETNISIEQLLQQDTPPASLVQTNLYEGGTQLWECSHDMNNYLTKHIKATDLLVPYFNILELGCGYGIPSIAILLFRCYHQLEKKTCIVFQDLNQHALEFSTLPSLFFSLKPYYSFNEIFGKTVNFQPVVLCTFNFRTEILDILVTQCEFLYGPWESLASQQDLPMPLKLNHKNDFHLILCCEALYRPVNYEWLEIILFKNLNKLKHSKAIFATKRYYFGIGGGSYEFLYFLQRTNPSSVESDSPTLKHQDTHISLKYLSNSTDEKGTRFHKNKNEKVIYSHNSLLGQIVYTFQDGRSNIRDILIVEFVL